MFGSALLQPARSVRVSLSAFFIATAIGSHRMNICPDCVGGAYDTCDPLFYSLFPIPRRFQHLVLQPIPDINF